MTHRSDIYLIDLADPEADIRRLLADSPYERVVVCRDGLEHIVGILRTSDLLKSAREGAPLDIEASLRPPLYVPESVTTTQLLANFRMARMQFALIVDEYGELEGLVTLTDVLTAIVGELPGEEENAYNTLGGFFMNMLGRIPAVAEYFEWGGFRFEIVDMDRNRVDKELVARVTASEQDVAQ